jgi:hypothetical protein
MKQDWSEEDGSEERNGSEAEDYSQECVSIEETPD